MDGARITLDYDPAARWFQALRIEQDGAEQLSLTLERHRTGVQGTFHFLRGVPLYQGPGPAGPAGTAAHVDEVEVPADFDAVGFALRAEATGPAAVLVLDPAGVERFNRTLLPGQSADALVELPMSAGTWKVVYAGLGNLEAEARLAGLVVYEGQV